ncbi:hypothetical protein [Sulfurovum sp.]
MSETMKSLMMFIIGMVVVGLMLMSMDTPKENGEPVKINNIKEK